MQYKDIRINSNSPPTRILHDVDVVSVSKINDESEPSAGGGDGVMLVKWAGAMEHGLDKSVPFHFSHQIETIHHSSTVNIIDTFACLE